MVDLQFFSFFIYLINNFIFMVLLLDYLMLMKLILSKVLLQNLFYSENQIMKHFYHILMYNVQNCLHFKQVHSFLNDEYFL